MSASKQKQQAASSASQTKLPRSCKLANLRAKQLRELFDGSTLKAVFKSDQFHPLCAQLQSLATGAETNWCHYDQLAVLHELLPSTVLAQYILGRLDVAQAPQHWHQWYIAYRVFLLLLYD
jgi:hypothetical protein